MRNDSYSQARKIISEIVGNDSLQSIGDRDNLFDKGILDSLSTLILLESLDRDFNIRFDSLINDVSLIDCLEKIDDLIRQK